MTASSPSTETIARHVLISGQVQGVGYRYSLAEQARSRNLLGWCRNLPDGRVEAWLQGPPDAVSGILDWIHVGPPAAVVLHVDIQNQPVTEALPDEPPLFEIRR